MRPVDGLEYTQLRPPHIHVIGEDIAQLEAANIVGHIGQAHGRALGSGELRLERHRPPRGEGITGEVDVIAPLPQLAAMTGQRETPLTLLPQTVRIQIGLPLLSIETRHSDAVDAGGG